MKFTLPVSLLLAVLVFACDSRVRSEERPKPVDLDSRYGKEILKSVAGQKIARCTQDGTDVRIRLEDGRTLVVHAYKYSQKVAIEPAP